MSALPLPPWYENPFRLISWWEMNTFSAHAFLLVGNTLGRMHAMSLTIGKEALLPQEVDALRKFAQLAASGCEQINLKISAKAMRRFEANISSSWSAEKLLLISEELKSTVSDEMMEQLFLHVPPTRSEWFSKDAEAILGAQCCARFASIQIETEEAAKCFAAGRYTACAFHLTRATEAGLKAVAKAIGFVPANDNWTLVFRELGNQFKLVPNLRPAYWQTHGGFLEKVWGDLRAISKAWRNDIAHLVDTYTEEEARELLTVIPMFLRDLATQMDETGKLY